MTLQISAKDLGKLAQPEFCPRCFWIQRHVKKLPFQIFPGIFSTIDSYSKKVTAEWFKKHGCAPTWLDCLGEFSSVASVPGRGTFFYYDKDNDVKLTGVPDEVLSVKDGGYFILDYKTARYTGNQDSLMPTYQVQLNGYALIAESIGMSPIRGLALVYYEPVNSIPSDMVKKLVQDDRFSMEFVAGIHEIDLKPDTLIPPLLARAKAIYDGGTVPGGRSGCDDCVAIDALCHSAQS